MANITGNDMSNGRTPVVEETKATVLTKVSRESAKMVTIGAGVAGVLFIPNLISQKLQTVSAPTTPKRGFTKAVLISGARTLGGNLTTSTMRTGVYGQRDHEMFCDNKPVLRAAKAAVGLGVADTLFTQIPRFFETWNRAATLNPASSVPVCSTLTDYGKILKIGFPPRVISSIFGIGGFLAAEQLKEMLGNSLPCCHGVDMNKVVATGGCAVFVGMITNALAGVVHTNVVLRTDPKTLVAPPSYSVTKDLIAKEGVKVLGRGLWMSAISTGLVYFTIPEMEKVAERVVPFVERHLRSSAAFFSNFLSTAHARFFQPAPAAPALQKEAGETQEKHFTAC